MRLVRCVILSVVLSWACVLLVPGCTSVRAGCPYCNYPSGALPAGTEVTCPRCFGVYRVYSHTKPDNSPPTSPAVPPQYHQSDEHPRRH